MDWTKQQAITPNGSQTLSKRPEAFLQPWYPKLGSAGRGCEMFAEGKSYIDLNGALGAVTIGYGEPAIFGDLQTTMNFSPSLSLPTIIEGESASVFVDRCSWIDQVRFVKSGSESNESAIRLSRIETGRSGVMFFAGMYHGWHSQLQCVAPYHEGILKDVQQHANLFPWPTTKEDFSVLEIELKSKWYACVILEPVQLEYHLERFRVLEFLRRLCTETGTVLIFDEVLTGFRYQMFGIAQQSGIHPDIQTFGKCLAQGLPLACVAGKKDLMRHAWTTSGTFGGEQVSLQAFLNVAKFYDDHDVIKVLTVCGQQLKTFLIEEFSGIDVKGTGPRLQVSFPDDPAKHRYFSFLKGCLDQGIFIHGSGGINLMFAHYKQMDCLEGLLIKVSEYLDQGGLTKEEMEITVGPSPAWRDCKS